METIVRLQADCVTCLLKKYMAKAPAEASEEARLAYYQGLAGIISRADRANSAPEIVEQINALRRSLFGSIEDYSHIKPHFNALLLAQEARLQEKINRAADPLGLALRYAMVGNFIDFGAMADVPEEKLLTLLQEAEELPLPEEEYASLRQDLTAGQRLVYLTDNCGEIVLDKLLLATILQQYPHLQAQVIVRGEPVLNDATLEDARQVGLDKVAPVTHNGTAVAGTCLHRIAPEAWEIIDAAHVIIAKGQGNFETLRGCDRNVYYLFLCKCRMFADRFSVPLYTGMLANDRRL